MMRIFLPLFIMVTIFTLSHQQGDVIGLYLFDGMDKVAHFIAYGLLCLSVIWALPRSFKRQKKLLACLIAVSVCLLFGISDEFHQAFVPGRDPSLSDFVADTAGALAACFIWFKVTVKQAVSNVVR